MTVGTQSLQIVWTIVVPISVNVVNIKLTPVSRDETTALTGIFFVLCIRLLGARVAFTRVPLDPVLSNPVHSAYVAQLH